MFTEKELTEILESNILPCGSIISLKDAFDTSGDIAAYYRGVFEGMKYVNRYCFDINYRRTHPRKTYKEIDMLNYSYITRSKP